jgi:hypothetical protein
VRASLPTLPPAALDAFLQRASDLLYMVVDFDSDEPLGETVLFTDGSSKINFFIAEMADSESGAPPQYARDVVAVLERPGALDEDAIHVFVVHEGALHHARVGRAVLKRDLPPRNLLDTRNHLPLTPPRGWDAPYRLEDKDDVYILETSECQVIARIIEHWEELWSENPKHEWRLEVGITRLHDAQQATDAQAHGVLAEFRNCDSFHDVTHTLERVHPSRRVFAARVGAWPEGTPWPAIAPTGQRIGPPSGWAPVGTFRDRPLVFSIEGTTLRVEWSPPKGEDPMAAAKGTCAKASRYVVGHTTRRKVTDDDVALVRQMLGNASFREVRRTGARPSGGKRVFESTAGWLRPAGGRAS